MGQSKDRDLGQTTLAPQLGGYLGMWLGGRGLRGAKGNMERGRLRLCLKKVLLKAIWLRG